MTRFYIVIALAAIMGYHGFMAVDGAKQAMGKRSYALAQAIDAAGR